jgi:hypothetical protein
MKKHAVPVKAEIIFVENASLIPQFSLSLALLRKSVAPQSASK